MAIPVPMYVDENALHLPSQIRLHSYGLTTGVEGVIGTTHCAIKALGTPGSAVQAMPGAFNILARHLGGSYEAYSGKYDIAETTDTISPTTSSGGRSDLVILRVENPYVSGAGTWDVPADPAAGPYAFIRVIEGVPATTWDVKQVNSTWSAITLAKITRPASTGVVQQSHITDLRSLAALGGTRTVYITNPPAQPPPIAQQVYAVSTKCTANDQLKDNETEWKDWPQQASWQVPVPDWAQSVSVMMTGTPASRQHVWAELRLNFGGTPFAAREIDINNAADTAISVYRANIPYGGVYSVPSSARGKVVTVKVQAHSAYSGSGVQLLVADAPDPDGKAGCYFDMWLLFQRNPA